MKVFFKNTATGVRYQIVKIDPKDAKDRKVVLQGEHGQFTELFDPERFKRMGYLLVQEQDEEAA